MATSVLACLFFIFFFPCFSNSCTTTLPCNPSIQIKPPFYFESDIEMGPNCQHHFMIRCDHDDNKPFIDLLWARSLLLESISYLTNIIRVQDLYLSSTLNKSGCRNLYFNFSSPINNVHYDKYELFNTSLSSVRCYPPYQIQKPPKIFGKDYNLRYSPSHDEDDEPPQNCLRPDNSLAPTLEYIFSFENDSSQLALLSANYSSDLVAWPGCFANKPVVLDHEDGEEKHFPWRIIIGCVIGSVFVLALCVLLVLFYKRKKLRLISSLSKLLDAMWSCACFTKRGVTFDPSVGSF